MLKSNCCPPQSLLPAATFAALRDSTAHFESPEVLKLLRGCDGKYGMLALLVSGEADAAEQAAWVLAALASHSDASRTEVAQAGVILPLVQLLRTEPRYRHCAAQAAKAIQWLTATDDDLCAKAASAGAIPALSRLLGKDHVAKEQASAALRNISMITAHRAQILLTALPALVALLKDGGSPAACEHAAAVVLNLASDNAYLELFSVVVPAGGIDALRKAVVAAGALLPLVVLLSTGMPAAQLLAAAALLNIAAAGGSLGLRKAIAAAGALPPLVKLLQGEDHGAREHAAGALRNITIADRQRDAVIAAKALEPLVELVTARPMGVSTEHAAAALCNITSGGDSGRPRRKAVVGAGAIYPLVYLLQEGSSVAKQHAAGAIANLAVDEERVRHAVAHAHVLPVLLQLLSDCAAAANAACAVANLVAGSGDPADLLITTSRSIEERLVGALRLGPPTASHVSRALWHLAARGAAYSMAVCMGGRRAHPGR